MEVQVGRRGRLQRRWLDSVTSERRDGKEDEVYDRATWMSIIVIHQLQSKVGLR